MGFQNKVNSQQAPAVAGDFASSNPRATVDAGEGILVAGAGGVTVGKFAWRDASGIVLSNGNHPTAPDGFVHREQQALIQVYLAEYGMNIPAGFPVILHNKGDFWAKNDGSGAVAIGDAAYARYSDGAVFFGSAPTNGVVTGSLGSTNTGAIGATFTASVNSDTTKIDVTAVTGFISIGDTVSGTGITPGTTIVSQDTGGTPNGAGTYKLSAVNTCSSATVTAFGIVLKTTSTTGLISIGDTVAGGSGFPAAATVLTQVSGTPGGAGVYTLSAPATAYVASASGVTTFGSVLDVTAVTSGALAVGDPVTGTGMPVSGEITAQLTGTLGGVGVYTLNNRGTAYQAGTTVTGVAGVLTSWKAASSGAAGELVKISTWN